MAGIGVADVGKEITYSWFGDSLPQDLHGPWGQELITAMVNAGSIPVRCVFHLLDSHPECYAWLLETAVIQGMATHFGDRKFQLTPKGKDRPKASRMMHKMNVFCAKASE